MNTYTDYHLDDANFDFLIDFKSNWEMIKDEYLAFTQDKNLDTALINRIMTPKTQTIKVKNVDTYSAIGWLFNGNNILQIIKKHQLQWEGIETNELNTLVETIFIKHFTKTQALIDSVNSKNNIIRTAYFSAFAPGMDIKCHVNANPHTYRAYLGLQVPNGDVAMKIGGEELHWHEGEIMVLDHTFPHCPHNRTSETRVALIIDFLRPNEDKNAMLTLEQDIMAHRMKANPYGFGVFGDDDVVSETQLAEMGLSHQDTWGSNLA